MSPIFVEIRASFAKKNGLLREEALEMRALPSVRLIN